MASIFFWLLGGTVLALILMLVFAGIVAVCEDSWFGVILGFLGSVVCALAVRLGSLATIVWGIMWILSCFIPMPFLPVG